MHRDGQDTPIFASLTAAIAFLPIGLLYWSDAPDLPSFALFLNLWILALYDYAAFRLPNIFTLTLFGVGVILVFATGDVALIVHHSAGAVVGGLIFPVIGFLYSQIRGQKGIGLGDAKLLAGGGIWLGWQLLPFVLLVASVGGILHAMFAPGCRQVPASLRKIPFGPYVCLGIWGCWLFG